MRPRGDETSAERNTAVAPVKLFNGKDLTNFYTYLAKPFGKNNDPKKVFTVADGMIRISGEVFGGLVTEKEYEKYHLVVEFKWGEKTWPPREKATRDSGILLHCVGADGAASGYWLESIECQMIEGGTGDFILVRGKGEAPKLRVPVEYRETGTGKNKGKQPYYNLGGEQKVFTGGRINWYGRDPKWEDKLGFRGAQDVENPVGEWNRLECVCDGDRITNILNGKVVNEGDRASLTRGKVLIQSEGAELFVRRIDLLPLKK